METISLDQPVPPQYLRGDDPKWREALSRALRRSEMDRERERQREGDRTRKTQRYLSSN